ncbi:MAG: NrfD/PsrC family molybdoenzyme membrane anchor subunit [Acidobacteriota bacterium]
MQRLTIRRLTFWKGVASLILIAGLYSTFVRFSQGLGASTALSDEFPWGLWVGFDVLCGVALAAGGFTISAVVYIFNLRRFKPIVRPAILTAFLGYVLVIVALLFDLGRSYRIWHALVLWNPHSVMFEVAWCVMLYSTVLALEFSPILLEKLGWERPLRVMHALTLPLVILGVILSMLHQSSLGSLYLIVPEKLHPLWYSPLLPVFFFVSALGLGCAMTIFESFLSYRAFGKKLELHLLAELGKVLVVVLSVYLVLKVLALKSAGLIGLIFASGYESRMFLAEILLGILGPIALLSIPRVRKSEFGLFVGAVMVVLGFIMNRLNISVTGMEASSGVAYFPSWTELSVTAMIVAAGFVLFGLAVRYLPVFSGAGEISSDKPAEGLPAVEVWTQLWAKENRIVLMLGGAVFAGALILGYFGIVSRQNVSASAGSSSQSLDITKGVAYFRSPPEITYPQSPTSPGPVTFRHSSHINPSQPECLDCHRQAFRILKSRASSAALPPREMHSDSHCGRCHDGKSAFSVEEECSLCHVEP